MGEVSEWEGEKGRRRREGEKLGEGEETGEGKETEGKGFAGPMSKYVLHVYAVRACERLHGKPCYLFICIRIPVGTVIFKTNNHKAK